MWKVLKRCSGLVRESSESSSRKFLVSIVNREWWGRLNHSKRGSRNTNRVNELRCTEEEDQSKFIVV